MLGGAGWAGRQPDDMQGGSLNGPNCFHLLLGVVVVVVFSFAFAFSDTQRGPTLFGGLKEDDDDNN